MGAGTGPGGLGAQILCPLLCLRRSLGPRLSPARTVWDPVSNKAEQAVLPIRMDLCSQVGGQHSPQHCRPHSES